MLDLTSLRKAVGSLERAVKTAKAMLADDANTDETELIRAGVIQNFEFTYELCWKFMRRWLEKNFPGQPVDGVTMKELFRMSAEHALIDDVEIWFAYHAARNKTSHVYDIALAQDVYETSLRFLNDARMLLTKIEAAND